MFWTILSVGLSLGAIGYLLQYIDLKRFVDLTATLPLWVPPVALAVYLFLQACRAARYRTLLVLGHRSWTILCPLTMYHNFLSQTLPLRAGEVSYIALVRRYLGRRSSEGVSSLASARLFDLLIVVVAGLSGLIVVGGRWEGASYTLTMAFLAVLLVLLLVTMYYAGSLFRFGLRGWPMVVAMGPWRGWGLLDVVGTRLQEVPGQLERIRSPGLLCRILALSLCTYGASLSFNLVILWGIGVDQNGGALMVVISIVMISSWFPFSLSGIGVIEGGWAVGLVALTDIDPTQAATIGIFMHGSQVMATAVTGLAGLGILLMVDKSRALESRTPDVVAPQAIESD